MAKRRRTREQNEVFSRVLHDLEEDLVHHHNLVTEWDRCYRAYKGVIESRSQAAKWTNKQHPQVVLQSIETMVASLLDPSPRWRLRAVPVIDDPREIERLNEGAKANEMLLNHQLQVTHYAETQRAFDLQGLILGTTASKQHWEQRRGIRKRVETVEEPVTGMYGQVIGSVPRVTETAVEASFRDDPVSEVVDMRDLVIPESAVSLAAAPRVAHRVWMTFEELKNLERDGVYGPEAGGEPIDLLKDGKSFESEHYNREQELYQSRRTKDLIEVFECYPDRGENVVTIGNRSVLLANKKNTFWFDHLDHMYPFVIASSTPDLFRVYGTSEVELMRDLQEMLWTLLNSRLDSLQLLSNAIFLIADDVEDPDDFVFGPGERWLVPRPVDETVKAWSPDPNIPQMTLYAESLLRKDIQDIVGASVPFQPPQGGQNINTATEAQIVTTLAQRRLSAKKQQFSWARSRVGEQWLALNQQFIRSSRLIPIIGRGGEQAFREISPEMIQGVFQIVPEMIEDSLIRQERRSEAQAKLQVAASVWQTFALAGQIQDIRLPNLEAFMEDYLEAFDVADKNRYWSERKQPSQPSQPAQPSQQLSAGSPPGVPTQPQPGLPQGAPGPNGQPGGVTSPLATEPTSPSNSQSISPEVFMQRMLAQAGGPRNIGG